MKLFLIKFFLIIVFLTFGSARGENFNTEYIVVSSGIKIGVFNWSLKTSENKYETIIYLENAGILSPLYNFEGTYISKGVIENNKYKTQEYKQYWKTKKKTKIVEISFNDYLEKLYQNPEEKEFPRIDVYSLFQYFDPITSFLNILNGGDKINVIDGRRVYTMKRVFPNEKKNITLEIKNYNNIWADHKRNDLKKIEFFMKNEFFLPEKIYIYFKNRLFKLKKI